jgi:hypothetical protein
MCHRGSGVFLPLGKTPGMDTRGRSPKNVLCACPSVPRPSPLANAQLGRELGIEQQVIDAGLRS